jgi:hypothetical protein
MAELGIRVTADAFAEMLADAVSGDTHATDAMIYLCDLLLSGVSWNSAKRRALIRYARRKRQ